MSGSLVVASAQDGEAQKATGQLVAAALESGGPVRLAIVAGAGHSPPEAPFAGLEEVLLLRTGTDRFDSEVEAAALRTLIAEARPNVAILASSIRTASFAAGVAESLDLGFASDVTAMRRSESGDLLIVRPIYGGKAMVEIRIEADATALVLLRGDIWPEAQPGPTPPVQEIPFEAPGASRVRHLEYMRPDSGIDLAGADVVFAVGRGVGDRERIKPFAEIADRLGAELGASRPVVDAGWLPAPRQVGQTGATVRPRLYVAFGISGAIQHLAGMRASGRIVAVNTDPDAAIFDVGHEGAVVDIHEVAAEIQSLLDAGDSRS